MAVTMICIGIPVCMALYKRIYYRIRGEISRGYQKDNQQNWESGLTETIGGGKPNKYGPMDSKKSRARDRDGSGGFELDSMGTTNYATGGKKPSSTGDASDEEILSDQHHQPVAHPGDAPVGITVTKSYRVENY